MAGNKYVGWCPQCGPREAVGLDEDGCCKTCGADATGPGADQALDLLKQHGRTRGRDIEAEEREKTLRLHGLTEEPRRW